MRQDITYRNKVVPPEVTARLVVEAAASAYWYQFVGSKDAVIGIDEFGASAPDKDVFRNFGFTVEHIVAKAKEILDATAEKVAPNTKKFVSGIGQ